MFAGSCSQPGHHALQPADALGCHGDGRPQDIVLFQVRVSGQRRARKERSRLRDTFRTRRECENIPKCWDSVQVTESAHPPSPSPHSFDRKTSPEPPSAGFQFPHLRRLPETRAHQNLPPSARTLRTPCLRLCWGGGRRRGGGQNTDTPLAVPRGLTCFQ